MRASLPGPRMTSAEFIDWARRQPSGRYELVDGEVVAMSPERVTHLRVKLDVAVALRAAVATAGLPCEVLPDGASIVIDDHHVHEPDALVRCGEPLEGSLVEIPDPLIVVEVLSPSNTRAEMEAKLARYWTVPPIRHCLVVDPDARTVTHLRRGGDESILTRIVRKGTLVLDPPGL